MKIAHRRPAWVPASVPARAWSAPVARELQAYSLARLDAQRKNRRTTLCHGLKDDNNLAEQLQQAILVRLSP